MTVLLDSWAWVEYFRDGKAAETVAEYIEGETEIQISTITIAEVFRALLQHEQKSIAERLTRGMIKRAVVIPVTQEIAWRAAEIKHARKWGLGDSLICATAELQHSKLVTGDSDFKGIPDVVYLGA